MYRLVYMVKRDLEYNQDGEMEKQGFGQGLGQGYDVTAKGRYYVAKEKRGGRERNKAQRRDEGA